jgi:anti-anti-sigma regulatory factor
VPGGLGGDGFTVSWQGDVAFVCTPREIGTWNAQSLWEALALVTGADSVIVVDMTATTVCAPAAFAAFLMALRQVDTGGGELRVVVADAALRADFATAGFARMLRVFDTVPAAMAAARGRRPRLTEYLRRTRFERRAR